jgi:DNA-binding transcriptional LysR family regulator
MKSTLEELAALRAVVDTGSITAAAEQLGQTASGISRALSRLEAKLDTTLLRRTTRQLALTEEGRQFLARARAVLAALDDAEEQLAARRDQPAGRLRVNAAAPYVLHALVPLIADFRARYPLIELEINTDDRVIDLLEQDTDVAIRIGPLRDSTLRSRPLGRYARRVLASPAYLAKHGRPKRIADLYKGHSLLGFVQPDALNLWPLRGPDGDGVQIEPSLRASSGETLRWLALQGAGIVCLADFMTAVDRRKGELVQVLPRETVELLQPVHAVYYRNTQLASRITCFLDFVDARLRAAAG